MGVTYVQGVTANDSLHGIASFDTMGRGDDELGIDECAATELKETALCVLCIRRGR